MQSGRDIEDEMLSCWDGGVDRGDLIEVHRLPFDFCAK